MAERGDAKTYSSEDMRSDAHDAFQRAQRYHGELREIYRYFMPWRLPTAERVPEGGGGSEGAKITDGLLDGTGPAGAFAYVANMKADWMPGFDDFFAIENGPLWESEDKAERNEALQKVTRVLHALLRPVRLTADEMFADHFAGTGAMLLNRGDKRQLMRGVSVPTLELALDNGPWGDVERWFWKRKYKHRHLEQTWPNATFSDKITRAIADDRKGETFVYQYTYWDPKEEIYRLAVWCDLDNGTEFWTEELKTTPWATPRGYVVPGECMGRGLAHLGLPFARTLNKARELALRAAAFALLGIWMRRNDNVFNPETAVMAPGAMWKVASTGGRIGPTLQRLDIPNNFDVSSIVISDEREQLRRVLLDDELPEVTDRVRSPTEIAGRMRRYDRNRGGATTRLALELIMPIVQRGVDIMAQARMLPSNLKIDDVLTQATVTAPAAAAQRSSKVDRVVSYLQILTGLIGPEAMKLVVKVEELMPQIGRDLGVDEQFIRRKTEVQHLQQIIAQQVQMELAKIEEANKARADGAAPQQGPEPSPDLAFMQGVQ